MIAVTEVRKTFGRVIALERVTFSLAAGERVALVGSNGSGKTTLLRALLGLVRFEGRITIGGVDVAREPEVALRNVAYIPQIAPPLDSPVCEVVRAHAALRRIRDEQTVACAARLGFDFPASARKRFRDLSGGMKQKLLAAMALATGAPVLVCDEPTANLDGDARTQFFAALAERPRDYVLVVCSHRLDEVKDLVQRVIAMQDGRIVCDGPARDLAASDAAPREGSGTWSRPLRLRRES